MTNEELTKTLEHILADPQSFLNKLLLSELDTNNARRYIIQQNKYIEALEHDVKTLNDLSTMRQNEISGLQKILDEKDIEIKRIKKRKDDIFEQLRTDQDKLFIAEEKIKAIDDLEFRLTKALERLSVVDAENCKLRYEFELLREKWLQIERILNERKKSS